MLAQFIVMSVVVRLLFTLLYHSSSSSPSLFVIFLVHINFIKKRILDLNKFIKNTTQVMVTLQNYELLLYWKWLKEKQFANQSSFCIAQTSTENLYFKKARVTFPTSNRWERLFIVYRCMTFFGITALQNKRKYYFTVDTYLNHCLQRVVLQEDLCDLLYKQ